jgi:pimeloyl-ACP methyl ester carboxylesterase
MAVIALHHLVEGSGPDLVMLHGGGGGLSDLDLLRGRLAVGRRVISPDQRGHGRSADPGEISYGAMAADTAALLDAIGVRRADVVGWSDGGIIGLLLARDRPELVGRLVAISANLAYDVEPSPLAPEAWQYLSSLRPADLPAPAGRDAIDPDGSLWPATAARIVAMWHTGTDLTLADLGGLAAPVLYVAADRDIVPLAHTVGMFEATPSARLAILPGARHQLAIERADDVAALIERFLAEVPRPGGATVGEAPA